MYDVKSTLNQRELARKLLVRGWLDFEDGDPTDMIYLVGTRIAEYDEYSYSVYKTQKTYRLARK